MYVEYLHSLKVTVGLPAGMDKELLIRELPRELVIFFYTGTVPKYNFLTLDRSTHLWSRAIVRNRT